MRVVSLVPSWTETLLACGVNVVGRTRFCVHPVGKVGEIAVLGGTKDLDRARLEALRPDFLLLDREENRPEMAEAPAGTRVHISHVRSTDDVPLELDRLAQVLRNQRLQIVADAWRARLEVPAYPCPRIEELPGVLRWIRLPETEPERILYLIWRGPWMAVSRDTFVGSMLTQVGFGGRLPQFPVKYPHLDLAEFDPAKTLLLFSSEPYPFGHKLEELSSLDFPSALVDGEAYSWFGLRSLQFLQGSRL